MSKYHIRSRIVHCASDEQARTLADADTDSRALLTGPGTLMFHRLIAEQGAGIFTTLYVPPAQRGKFVAPIGADVQEAS